MSGVDFLFNYTGSNGTKKEYLIISESDDVLVPFKYTFIESNDTNIKTNFDNYVKNIPRYNILIDCRMMITITYMSSYFNDVLVYDSGTNKIITFNTFSVKRLFAGQVKICDQDTIQSAMFIYIFVKFFCRKLAINWSVSSAIRAVSGKKYLKHSINIRCLIDYLIDTKFDCCTHILTNYTHIADRMKIQDSIIPFDTTRNDLMMELREINKDSSFILF